MSSSRQGFLRHLPVTPRVFRHGINLWPPFRAARIKLLAMSDDWKRAEVRLRLGLFNRNYFGTQYGGSMFSMTDPFYVLMLAHILGRDTVVWDKAASIRYLKPARGDVFARFELDDACIEAIRAAIAGGDKHEPRFTIAITDAMGEVVAEVERTLYVRRRTERA